MGPARSPAFSPNLVLVVVLAFGCTDPTPEIPPQPPRLPNVAIVVLDTVRWQAFSELLSEPGRFQAVRAWIEAGTLYERAYATHDSTPPSHFAILTGYRDGLGTQSDRADRTLPAFLKRLGYRTVGIVANGNLSQKTMRVMLGFEHFVNLWERPDPNPDASKPLLDAVAARHDIEIDATVRRRVLTSSRHVLEELRRVERVEHPTFLLLNFMDAHDPYLPGRAYYDTSADPKRPHFYSDLRGRPTDTVRYRERRPAGFGRKLWAVGGRKWSLSHDLTSDALERYRRKYRASLAELLESMDDLRDLLDGLGWTSSDYLLLTSDHGEAFGEMGFLTHSMANRGEREATRHVPLVVVMPGAEGRRVSTEVSIADITPTIGRRLGIQWVDGAPPAFGRVLPEQEPADPVPVRVEVFNDTGTIEDDDRPERLEERLRALGYVE